MSNKIPVFTLQEVACQLDITPETLFQHVVKGKLRATKHRRPKGYSHMPEIDTYSCTQHEIDQFKYWLETSTQHDPIYSIQDVAMMLKLNPAVVYAHICEGRLKAYKIRSSSAFGLKRKAAAYRCSRAQIDELKTLLKQSKSKRKFVLCNRAAIAQRDEEKRNAHNLSIAQQLNGMLKNEKRK